MAVVPVGKVRHRACLTVRVGVAEALRVSSPLPPICCCGGALLALVAACPAALARSRHSQGWLSPHHPSRLGRHVKGHVDSGPFGASPPLAASSSALPSGRGCPRGRETDRDGPDAPCAPLGCLGQDWHLGRIYYPLSHALCRGGGGRSLWTRLPHPGASLTPSSPRMVSRLRPALDPRSLPAHSANVGSELMPGGLAAWPRLPVALCSVRGRPASFPRGELK